MQLCLPLKSFLVSYSIKNPNNTILSFSVNEEAYKTWNMGQGMIIATPSPKEVISISNQHNIEAKKIGKVLKCEERGILINSKVIQHGKDILFYLD